MNVEFDGWCLNIDEIDELLMMNFLEIYEFLMLKIWWLCLELNGELLNIVETLMIMLEIEWWIIEWLWLSSTNLELQCKVLKWWWIWTFVRVREWREWWEIVRDCEKMEKWWESVKMVKMVQSD